MYSGSTLTPFSGNILGAHQKIDRIARRELAALKASDIFPDINSILHFEGHNGPDAIKRKSPARDEPWHFFRPFDMDDNQLISLVEGHYTQLVAALKKRDTVRASFEAAWLAHAIVDGLTPAHQFPFEEKLVELSSGRPPRHRSSVKEKILLPGESLRHRASNNWKYWGPKGLFTTHYTFEWGVAMLIAPMKFQQVAPNSEKVHQFQILPLGVWFRTAAQDVARMNLYDSFYKTGWTIPLARRIRRQLAPALIQAVTLVWYGALLEARGEDK